MTLPIVESKTFSKEELCLLEEIPQSCGVTIFGASGDLTQRKLLPSLFFLMKTKRMPAQFYILGMARTNMSDEDFRKLAKETLPADATPEEQDQFLEKCFYLSGDYSDPEVYRELSTRLDTLDKKFKIENRRLYYLSTPPSLYPVVVKHLGEAGLVDNYPEKDKWNRVIIEKPFGASLESALELNDKIRFFLREKQIYRIDHYLGKETVQNILMFRFANVLFEPVWNRNYVDHIQITASEELGVEHRAGYYDQAGVLRDMFQNHLLQLLALIAMEQPVSLESDAVRDKKVDVLRGVQIMNPSQVAENTICAQYGPGDFAGKKYSAYLGDPGVRNNSVTPTFAAIKFEIDNWRWKGVPFYIRSGKRLPKRLVEIVVQFKHVPSSIFKPLTPEQLTPNTLIFRIQPDEGIRISFEAKHPGPKLCLGTVTMDFAYQEAFHTPPPESYVRLFHDAMLGEQSLFSRSDGVETCWEIMDPIINFWESSLAPKLPSYKSFSWGPKEADNLMQKTGRSWLLAPSQS